MSSFDILDNKFRFCNNSDVVAQAYGFKFFGTEDKILPIFIVVHESDSNKTYM